MENELKRMRFEHGQMTQAELAAAAEVSRQTVISIESGKFVPSVRLALIFARIFKCQVEEIFKLEQIEKQEQ